MRRPDHRLDRAVPRHVSQQGKFQVTNIPLPADISTKVANKPNFYGSLIKETLNWSKVSIKVKGKTVVQQRLGRLPEGQAAVVDHLHRDDERHDRQTSTVNGSAKC